MGYRQAEGTVSWDLAVITFRCEQIFLRGDIMIRKQFIGKTSRGEDVHLFTLPSRYGSVGISSLGASVESIVVPDRGGNPVDVVLGFDNVSAMESQSQYIGSIVGRYANRIGGGTFKLNGRIYNLAVNDPPNHLHGGINGFNRKVWDYEVCDNKLVFYLFSADGDEGYPGNLEVTAAYEFGDSGKLTISYDAVCDADTIVNLTNHTYFNLSGHSSSSIDNHLLSINADYFTHNDEHLLPDGEITAVEGTPMDFRSPRAIGEYINCSYEQIQKAGGYDHNYIIKKSLGEYGFAAQAASEKTGVSLTVFTDMPGLQFYSGNGIGHLPLGKQGMKYEKRSGFCLETQFYPNAMAHCDFPSPVLKAMERYIHHTCYQFGIT